MTCSPSHSSQSSASHQRILHGCHHPAGRLVFVEMLNPVTIRERLRQAYEVAQASPDPSSQNGVVIYSAEHLAAPGLAPRWVSGFNAFLDGVASPEERWERPVKYSYIEHEERRAVYSAARYGVTLEGATMYAAWAACADCARAIVATGIKTVVRHAPDHSPYHASWGQSIEIGDTIMTEGGVTIITYTDPLPEAPAVLRDGELWQP